MRANSAAGQGAGGSDPQAQLLLQKEIIAKERRIFDLERKLRQSTDEVRKLKDERDRLVQISAELRAELNRTRRTVAEYKGYLQQLDGGKGGAARLVSGGGDPGMQPNAGGLVVPGKSLFSFDDREYQGNSNVIKEDPRENQLADSGSPHRKGHSRSPRNLPTNNNEQNYQQIQLEQQTQLQNLSNVVSELAG